MIYTPSQHPKQAFILISIIVLMGIFGSLLHPYFLVVSLIFWMQYTAILSYLQFIKQNVRHKTHNKHKKASKTWVQSLLNPQLRFFLFVFIATIGLASIFVGPGTIYVGIAALIWWWLFSLNFYIYYEHFKRHES